MTTKPRAKKFRVRRSGVHTTGASQPAQARPAATPPVEEPVVRTGQVSSPAEVSAEEQLNTIRREGLTGRQLRMARRIAQRHNLPATSDYDAVRLLRAQGIDPFKRANMLELVVADGSGQTPGAPPPQNLPQTVPQQRSQLPSTEVLAESVRAREIGKIQLDIARRRRRKVTMLLSRLAFFVMLPTLLAAYYYFVVATPLYATYSEFQIQKSESTAPGVPPSLLSGTQFATSQDSIAVQSFLESRDAMLRLDEEYGYVGHFSGDNIDPILRLSESATNEEAYRLYSKRVSISYDPTEGIIRMEVIAADPETSAAFSRALISYAEERVDNLSQRVREDRVRGARESYEEAELRLTEAQQHVIGLQEQYNVISTETEVGLITGQISALEQRLTEERLDLAELLANDRPNQARVEPMQRRIETLREMIAEERSKLTSEITDGRSLAQISSELAVAQMALENRNLLITQALQNMETARVDADRQTLFLSESVSPTASDEATFPRRFESTILAFLIFSGIYLMASLTASILREQVSS